MRVFVIGATGFIGSAIVNELIKAGHEVLGLARSDSGAASLAAAGAEVLRGSLEDIGSLSGAAAAADGVIYTARDRDIRNVRNVFETERRSLEAIGAALAGSDRPLLVATGMPATPGRIVTEADNTGIPIPTPGVWPHPMRIVPLELAASGVRAALVRLPLVHGDGDRREIPRLIMIARKNGVSAYEGNGLNRWPAVHRLDAARLFRLALEHGAAERIYHAVAEEGVPFKDIAAVIARRLDVPLVSKTAHEAFYMELWTEMEDMPASSERTQALLGWEPTEPGLIADIDRPAYFESGMKWTPDPWIEEFRRAAIRLLALELAGSGEYADWRAIESSISSRQGYDYDEARDRSWLRQELDEAQRPAAGESASSGVISKPGNSASGNIE
jgi:nucleoside-diphosphate-sugar epimerase